MPRLKSCSARSRKSSVRCLRQSAPVKPVRSRDAIDALDDLLGRDARERQARELVAAAVHEERAADDEADLVLRARDRTASGRRRPAAARSTGRSRRAASSISRDRPARPAATAPSPCACVDSALAAWARSAGPRRDRARRGRRADRRRRCRGRRPAWRARPSARSPPAPPSTPRGSPGTSTFEKLPRYTTRPS